MENVETHQIPLAKRRQRNLPVSAAFGWLAAGWRDLWHKPLPSLAYGLLVFVTSALIIGGLLRAELDYILLPALAGFMVVGPLLAVGLYAKSRDLEEGLVPSLGRMVFVRPESGGQIMFTGAILCILMLLWIRSAVIIYALFFGLRPVDGTLRDITSMLLTTPQGWGILGVGTVVGGIFAAFSFAISAFAIPMMLAEKTDAFTAMGTSISMVWNNLPVMIGWGAIVLTLSALGVLTGCIGLILVFPVLGHATWHSFRTIR